MKLPNGNRAIVDLSKLVDYCLSPEHPLGKHKARVFESALGLTQSHAAELQRALLRAAESRDAEVGEEDAFGRRYVVDFEMEGPAGRGIVRSAWIVLTSEDIPRLTSCYVICNEDCDEVA